jgi:hypothetical protein
MKRARRTHSLLAAGVLAVCLQSCSQVTLHAQQRRVEKPQWARVEVGEIDRDILAFDVYNLSKLNLVVLRDKIVLETARGRRGREPGGSSRYYNVPPGGMHDVKVKFELGDCQPGEEVRVLFESALVVDGTPVPMAPIPFVCR